ncbi:MAG: sulfite exporter TauE/SafE family protein [Clostridiales bacterium]|nr:sulfite exporter TauE/SafE family protein [Clostridiales bacterium]
MEKHKKFKNFFIKNIFAVMVGFVNGFFGGGGGLICVPTLEKVYKLDTKTAHATTVSIMLPLSIISSIIYIVHSKMNIFNTLAVTIGSVIGGLIGAFALKKSNSKFIKWLFIAILFAAGVRMVV